MTLLVRKLPNGAELEVHDTEPALLPVDSAYRIRPDAEQGRGLAISRMLADELEVESIPARGPAGGSSRRVLGRQPASLATTAATCTRSSVARRDPITLGVWTGHQSRSRSFG